MEKLETRHKCDNRWCVNPDHILCGTHLQNMRDKNKNPKPKLKNQRNKLNEFQVKVIKIMLRNKKLSGRKIAQIFGVNESTISAIKVKEHWKHITIN